MRPNTKMQVSSSASNPGRRNPCTMDEMMMHRLTRPRWLRPSQHAVSDEASITASRLDGVSAGFMGEHCTLYRAYGPIRSRSVAKRG